MKITSGKIQKALKVLVYGPEGIGKSTFAAMFPNPLFLDTEGSTDHMDVNRANPASWTELQQMINEVANTPGICSTLVIDTVDWAERMCMDNICASRKISSIEDMGYGKGYMVLCEEFGKFLDALSLITDRGINVVLTAHSMIRTITLPDEMGTYDRWELKLQKKTSPIVKEWSDLMLFANYKTYIVKDANGKGKAQGGKRMMYTTHNTTYDAKNRFGLQEELPFAFESIASIIPAGDSIPAPAQQTAQPIALPVQEAPKKASEPPAYAPGTADKIKSDTGLQGALTKLQNLMVASGITEEDVRKVVSHNGMRPLDMAIPDYGQEFIEGFIIPNWESLVNVANALNDVPF